MIQNQNGCSQFRPTRYPKTDTIKVTYLLLFDQKPSWFILRVFCRWMWTCRNPVSFSTVLSLRSGGNLLETVVNVIFWFVWALPSWTRLLITWFFSCIFIWQNPSKWRLDFRRLYRTKPCPHWLDWHPLPASSKDLTNGWQRTLIQSTSHRFWATSSVSMKHRSHLVAW